MKKKLLFLCLLFMVITDCFAQVRGTTVSVTKPLPFNNSFSNVTLDPTPVTGSNSRVQYVNHFNAAQSPSIGLNTVLNLIGADVSIPGWLTNLGNGVPFFCSGYSTSLNVNASVDVGGYYQVRSVGRSDIDVDYPVQVYITYPQANTFACGEVIRINTSYTILQPSATKLKVKPPFVNQEIGPILNNLSLGASINANAWVGYGVSVPYICETGICYYTICGNTQSFNNGVSFNLSPSLPNLPSLVNVCENAFGPGANNATLLGCNWSAATPFLNLGQSALDAYNATHNTNYTFAEFPDHHTVKIAPPDLADGPTIPEMEGTFRDISNTGLNYSLLNNGTRLKVNGKKSSISEMSFDLSSLLDYFGYTTSKSLGGGQGSIDIGDISPTMTIDQTLNFEYDPKVHLQVNLGVPMAYTVFNSNNTPDHSGNGQIVSLLAGQYIDAVVPQGRTTAMQASGSSSLDGTFTSQSSQEYFRSLKLALGQVQMANVIDFTLLQTELFKEKFGEKGIIDHSFNLALPNSITLPPFTLDPENPVIDVSYLHVSDIRNIGGGKRKVVYKIGLSNQGDVLLSNVQSTINLASAFASAGAYRVVCINSDDLAVNNAFNGNTDKNLLAAGNQLTIGQTKYLELVVEITPAKSAIIANGCFGTVNYIIASKATATSPIGTNIQSDYNQCTLQTTGADITTAVDLGAEKINALQDFTIYGWKKVVFDKSFATSYGNVGSYQDMVFENVSQQNAPPVIIIGDIHVNERFRLIGESKLIADNLQLDGIADIGNNSALYPTGAVSANSNCVTVIAQPGLAMPVNNSTVNINVNTGATLTLNPGSYRSVSVEKNGVLILTNGVYNIDTWKIKGENVQVKYQLNGQTITMHVNKFQPEGKDNLQMKLDGTGKVSDINLFVYGNPPVKFASSFIQGKIMAPIAEVEFGTNSQLEGSCYAEKVNFKTGSVFKGTKYTLPLNVNAACQQASFTNNSVKAKTNTTMPPAYQQQANWNTLGAYPNPTTDKIMITGLNKYQDQELGLFDMQGRLLRKYIVNAPALIIHLQDLKSGIYILKTPEGEQGLKIIKQ